MFASLFQQYKLHAEFYTLLYKQGLTDIILQTIKDVCGPKPEMGSAEAYAKAFLAYGTYGWVVEWIARGMTDPPESFVFTPPV